MMKPLFIAIFFLCFGSLSFASYDAKSLRRVSFLLTGTPASSLDLKKIEKLPLGEKKDFFNEKIRDYQGSKGYIQKMRERMEELFQVQVSHHGKVSQNNRMFGDANSAMDLMIDDLFKGNQPWNQLLIGKDYRIPISLRNDSFEDPRGFSDMLFLDYTHKPTRSEEVAEIVEYLKSGGAESGYQENSDTFTFEPKNDEASANTAGIITTNGFFSRYPTTRINKNRKRAAAIFRVFLCDSMTPAVTGSNEENIDLLKLSFNETKGATNVEDIEDLHGSDPQCKACHKKLDPAGNTFIGSGVMPNNRPTAGALVYQAEQQDGSYKLVNIPVEGLGDLGEKISEQQEYLNCQVKHFWNWFVGDDIPLGYTKKVELAKKFVELETRPNDFIEFLLNTDDFQQPKKIDFDDIRYSDVKPIFKKCDSCHQNEPLAPILSQGYPFGGNKGFNDFTLKQVIWASDLREEAAKDYMPPSSAGWKLDGEARKLMKAWIKGGAKDDSGRIQIKDSKEFRLNKITYTHSELDRIKFKGTSTRFLNNFDIIETMSTIYGSSWPEYGECSELEDKGQKLVFGLSDPKDGKSLFDRPSSVFMNWIYTCVNETFKVIDLNKFVSKKEVAKDWSELTDEEKKRQIHFSLNQLIGESVLSAENEAELISKIFNSLPSAETEISQSDVIKLIHVSILMSPEFLTF